jgi:hemophore-related protein
MTHAVTIMRRTAFGLLAAGAAGAALVTGSASADPEPVDNCNASSLAETVSSVTASLSDYFEAHPDVNQALIDITRQPAFVAIGQFDGYFGEHPQQADELRAIQQPLVDYKNRCGMQVSPTDSLAVLAEV